MLFAHLWGMQSVTLNILHRLGRFQTHLLVDIPYEHCSANRNHALQRRQRM